MFIYLERQLLNGIKLRRARRPVRRAMRPMRPVRRIVRAQRRRRRRRIRRTRRFLFGSAMIFAMAGSLNNYKLYQDDVSRVEEYYKRPVEDLTEAELIEGMRKLGIRQIQLSEDEENAIVDEIGEE